ncbi:MAG: cytochrome c, partial [Burkholderiaceae bacterium]|nr:cytochrome c [Burkholderiaceae bacterium]
MPMTGRQIELVRLVRQDCGACHGMRLTGGLGPAVTAQALPGRTPDSVSATILYGRPGTPMPGW